MRKYIYKISALLLICLAASQSIYAQAEEASLRDRLSKKKEQQEMKVSGAGISKLSVRAEKLSALQTRDLSNATWVREIYRILDVKKGSNAALYYPTEPTEGRMNLLTMIVKLMSQGNLTAYEFLDGRESFTDQYKIEFKDVLDRMGIPFEQDGNTYSFNEMDIPTTLTQAYYVKEAWYFDQSNSVLDTRIIAICPVISLLDDLGLATNRYPLFWIPYENIRPYTARMPMLTSDRNNALNKTIDDYFRLRLYEGEIYKTTNMENKILKEKVFSEEDSEEVIIEKMKVAQKKIEDELEGFEKGLWVINDSIKAIDADKRTEKAKNQKAPKRSKSIKASSSSTSAKFSARDRR